MARISGRNAIKQAIKEYGGSGVGFFSLKEDNEKATVRFLHTNDEDLDIYVVHGVEVDKKDTYIECLQNESCPLCAAGNKAQMKVFFSMYVPKEDKILVWDRGPGIIDDIIGLIDKYGHLTNRSYEIVRHGKPNDTKTKYQLFAEDKSEHVDNDGKPLGKRPDVLGKFVKVWTKAEMELAIQKGEDIVPDRKNRTAAVGGKKTPGF